MRGTVLGRGGRMVCLLEVTAMNLLHLIWIIPSGVAVGLWLASLLRANGRDDENKRDI